MPAISSFSPQQISNKNLFGDGPARIHVETRPSTSVPTFSSRDRINTVAKDNYNAMIEKQIASAKKPKVGQKLWDAIKYDVTGRPDIQKLPGLIKTDNILTKANPQLELSILNPQVKIGNVKPYENPNPVKPKYPLGDKMVTPFNPTYPAKNLSNPNPPKLPARNQTAKYISSKIASIKNAVSKPVNFIKNIFKRSGKGARRRRQQRKNITASSKRLVKKHFK